MIHSGAATRNRISRAPLRAGTAAALAVTRTGGPRLPAPREEDWWGIRVRPKAAQKGDAAVFAWGMGSAGQPRPSAEPGRIRDLPDAGDPAVRRDAEDVGEAHRLRRISLPFHDLVVAEGDPARSI